MQIRIDDTLPTLAELEQSRSWRRALAYRPRRSVWANAWMTSRTRVFLGAIVDLMVMLFSIPGTLASILAAKGLYGLSLGLALFSLFWGLLWVLHWGLNFWAERRSSVGVSPETLSVALAAASSVPPRGEDDPSFKPGVYAGKIWSQASSIFVPG